MLSKPGGHQGPLLESVGVCQKGSGYDCCFSELGDGVDQFLVPFILFLLKECSSYSYHG